MTAEPGATRSAVNPQPRWGNCERNLKGQAIVDTLRLALGSRLQARRWLDIGCGSGGIARQLVQDVDSVVGVDPEPWPQWPDMCSTVTIGTVMRAGHSLRRGGIVNKSSAEQAIRDADYLLLPARIKSLPVLYSNAVERGCPVIAPPVGDLLPLVAQGGGVGGSSTRCPYDRRVGARSFESLAPAIENISARPIDRILHGRNRNNADERTMPP